VAEEGKKTLADFDFGETRVFPVGRLDKDSRGLLLMTNDGELANRLTHPSYEHEKEYLVTLGLTIADLKRIRIANIKLADLTAGKIRKENIDKLNV